MSQFLNSEQIDAIGKALESGDVPSQEPEPTPEPEQSADASEEEAKTEETEAPEPQEEPSEEAAMDAKEASSEEDSNPESTEEAQSESTEGSGKHRVPYTRFQEVVHARNKYQSEVDDLRKQQEALQAELNRLQSEPAKKQSSKAQDYDDYDMDDMERELDGDLETPSEEGWRQRYDSLSGRVEAFEFEQAKQSIESALGEAEQKYPAVPRQALLQYIVDTPPRPSDIREKVFEVAERYSSYIAQVEEAAIARHLESQGKEVAGKEAAPRPAKTSNPASVKAVSAGDQKPRTLKDASKALRKFMEDTNPFG